MLEYVAVYSRRIAQRKFITRDAEEKRADNDLFARVKYRCLSNIVDIGTVVTIFQDHKGL